MESLTIREARVPTEDYSTITVELILRSGPQEEPGKKMQLEFDGVRDLRTELWHGNLAVSLLKIFPVRDRQWEDIVYRVIDSEEGVIAFYCKDFSARIIS